MPSVQKPSSALEQAAVDAAGAFVDGRCRNIIFKHKQLIRLFDCLKTESPALLDSLANGSPAHAARLADELMYALKQVSAVIEKIPVNMIKASAEYATLSDAAREGGVRRSAVGTTVILADEAHPLASWIVPLSAAIYDGNSAIVSIPPSLPTLYTALRRPFHLALDQDAFHLVSVDPRTVAEWLTTTSIDSLAGVTTLGDLPTSSSTVRGTLPVPLRRNFHYNAIPRGPWGVIVDQSLLPGGQPLNPLDDGVSPVPTKIDQAAKAVAVALASTNPADDSPRSTGLPGFILVHENVAQLFMRALTAHLPSGALQPHVQAIKGIESILSGGMTARGLDYLPVFTVTSFDHALDLVQDRLPESFATYVFATPRFGAYSVNNSNVRLVCVNQIPGNVLAAGPYVAADDFSHTVRRAVKISKSPEVAHDARSLEIATSLAASQQALAKQLADLQVRPVKQVPGSRIDFFGGSFLLAALPVLAIILSGSGYGLYKGGKAILGRF